MLNRATLKQPPFSVRKPTHYANLVNPDHTGAVSLYGSGISGASDGIPCHTYRNHTKIVVAYYTLTHLSWRRSTNYPYPLTVIPRGVGWGGGATEAFAPTPSIKFLSAPRHNFRVLMPPTLFSDGKDLKWLTDTSFGRKKISVPPSPFGTWQRFSVLTKNFNFSRSQEKYVVLPNLRHFEARNTNGDPRTLFVTARFNGCPGTYICHVRLGSALPTLWPPAPLPRNNSSNTSRH